MDLDELADKLAKVGKTLTLWLTVSVVLAIFNIWLGLAWFVVGGLVVYGNSQTPDD